MNSELWSRVETVFAEVCDLPADERARRVADLCGDDFELRAEVETLVENDSAKFLSDSPHLPAVTPPGPERAFLPPEVTLDEFEIGEIIGRGGQGTVYLARQRSLDREVALKVITHALGSDATAGERFRREAHAVAKLAHSHIVQVHSYGERDGHRYYSMEFVGGGTAAALARPEGGLDRAHVECMAKLGLGVARALAFAHQNGVIHRDVKPTNVLIGEDGSPKLVDFGLAKEAEQHSLSVTGDLLGTPQYLSPEALRGEPPTARVDLYGWGATIFHLLSGRPPFEADTLHETLRLILSAERPELDPAVPRDLRVIVGKCLEKRADDRYCDADALVDDLERFLEGRPILARPVGRAARWGRALIRHPWTAVAGVTMLLALAVAITTGLQAWRSARRAEGLEYLRAASEVLEENPRLSLLLAVEGARRTPGLEANEALYAALTDTVGFGSEVCGYTGHHDWIRCVRFDSRGERLVSAARDGTACLHELDRARPSLTLRGHRAELFDARFSPDGSRIITASFDGTARIWSSATGDQLARFDVGTPVFRAQFVGDDDRVLTASFDGQVRVFDRDGKVVTRVAAFPRRGYGAYRHAYGVERVAVDRRGISFAAVDDQGALGVWSLAGDRRVHVQLADEPFDGRFVSFSADGRRVAAVVTRSAAEPARLGVIDLESGALSTIETEQSIQAPVSLAWGPAGDRIALADADEVVVVSVPEGGLIGRFPANVSSPHGLGFLDDGDVIYNGQRDGTVEIWDVEASTRLRVLRGHDASIGWTTVSPDRRWLIAAGEDPRFRRFAVDRDHSDWIVDSLRDEDGKGARAQWVDGDGSFAVCGTTLRLRNGRGEDCRLPVRARFVERLGDRLLVVTTNTVELWSEDGQRLETILDQSDSIRCAAVSRDRRRVAVGTISEGGDSGAVSLFDFERETTLTWKAHTGPVRAIAFDSDGSRLATASLDQTAAVWSSGTGVELTRLRGHGVDVRSLAFHPERDELACGTWDGSIHFWDASTGQSRARVDAHARSVESLEWQSKGRLLFSASYDGEVRVWSDARQCLSVQRLPGGVVSADLSPQSGELLLVGLDRNVYRISYPPFPVAQERTADRAFYTSELVALGLGENGGALPVARRSTALDRLQEPWLTLRNSRSEAGAVAVAVARAHALDEELGGPDFTRILVGVAELRAGKVEAAIEHFESIRDRTPVEELDAICLAGLSLAYRAKGEPERADRLRDLALAKRHRYVEGGDELALFLE